MLRFSVWKTMLNLNVLGVEIFINKSNEKDLDSFWNNYDLVIWKKNANGYTNIKGMFRKDNWGTAEKISADHNGIWKLPKKYVKYFK